MSKECRGLNFEEQLFDFAENNQLISIFVTSIGTTKQNKKKTS